MINMGGSGLLWVVQFLDRCSWSYNQDTWIWAWDKPVTSTPPMPMCGFWTPGSSLSSCLTSLDKWTMVSRQINHSPLKLFVDVMFYHGNETRTIPVSPRYISGSWTLGWVLLKADLFPVAAETPWDCPQAWHASGGYFPLVVDRSWPAVSPMKAKFKNLGEKPLPGTQEEHCVLHHMPLLCIFQTLGIKSGDKAQISSYKVILQPDSVGEKFVTGILGLWPAMVEWSPSP